MFAPMGDKLMVCRDYEETLQSADGDNSELQHAAPESANSVVEAPKPVNDAQASSL